jgi:hypothetical protein
MDGASEVAPSIDRRVAIPGAVFGEAGVQIGPSMIRSWL